MFGLVPARHTSKHHENQLLNSKVIMQVLRRLTVVIRAYSTIRPICCPKSGVMGFRL